MHPASQLIVDSLEYPQPDRRWFEEWREGNVSCVHVTVAIWEDARETLARLGMWRRALRENADLVRLSTTASDIRANAEQGLTTVIMGFQNTAPIEHDIELIETFRQLGVCIMQLTYNLQNYIGAGYWEAEDTGISSRFGRNAIAEMNRVGALIDLSHCGERTTREAIDLSARPVAITHSNPREYHAKVGFGERRLKETAAVQAMVERGGMIGLCPNRFMTQNGVETSLDQFCDMVAWMADRIGAGAIGIGTDYCAGHDPSVRTWWRYARWSRESAPPTTQAPHEGWQDWLRSPVDLDNIRGGLLRRGFSDAEAAGIMGDNWIRFFEASFRPMAEGAEQVGAAERPAALAVGAG